ncbi:MAG: hypothetical protein HY308_03880 [Gammaproteobacteria bacterium]|nr:hypothetical protein [Gammaproteobacteria bacterium]
MRKQRLTMASSILAVLISSALPVTAHSASTPTPPPPTAKTAQTASALRDLWIGHGFWVRELAAATLAGNAAAATNAENQAIANAKQIAAAIEPFYGKAASEKLFQLLAGHYGAIKQYLDAVAKGDSSKQDAGQKAMLTNGGELAVFLSNANPNLPVDTVRAMLIAHGGHHVQQIQQLKSKDYAGEAQTWEAMKSHMYAIADALAGALAKQFPEKFS